MGTFAASLRALGDVKGLPATVELEDGVLSIAAGDVPIGEWAVKDIRMEPIPSGYRIAAEGDQILLELKELERFNEELEAKTFSIPSEEEGRQGKGSCVHHRGNSHRRRRYCPNRSRFAPVRLEPQPEQAPKRTRKPAKKATTNEEAPQTFWGKVLAWVDNTLDKAADRFGPYLPEWVFTRLMFAIAFGAVILALILPGYVSAFMLIAGALIIVFGAIIYSDPMLTSKWLPGRTTPTHVLLFGVVILMLGVLLGILSG